jgi:hypothetical protein
MKNFREFFPKLGFSIYIIKKEAAKLDGQGARSSPFCVLVILKDFPPFRM